ncbi:hypothetical protein FACS1894116_07050 [Betaproteobacteria bacterium]|nr:hypothetical protein FACS1894116_07050 [Betaproteobacteria bacterium]GHU25006.1 hypothetical protein FACS189488_10920 [Betaproteobacteria bacterium]GHU32358.1 hypothetical protein FACS189497_13890 [Betaproteobacteria bacterium]
MTALTQAINVPRRDAVDFVFPVGEGVWIHAGALVAINATGYAVPGVTGTGLQGVGIAQASADNRTGEDGDITIKVRRGCFALDNSDGGGAITLANVGKACYIVDDQTVTLTASGKSPAGIVRDVNVNGVWVEF